MFEMTAFSCAFAFFNRCRGSQIFNLVSSTTIGRLVSMFAMALAAAIVTGINGDYMKAGLVLAWAWVTLELWCIFKWDAYWSAEIGHDQLHSRLWGLMMMTLRMTLAAPCIIGLALITDHQDRAFYSFGTLLLGLPYYFWGYLNPANAVERSEYTVGSILGTLIFLTIQ